MAQFMEFWASLAQRVFTTLNTLNVAEGLSLLSLLVGFILLVILAGFIFRRR